MDVFRFPRSQNSYSPSKSFILCLVVIAALIATFPSHYLTAGPNNYRFETKFFIHDHTQQLNAILSQGINQAAACRLSPPKCQHISGLFIYKTLPQIRALRNPTAVYFIRATRSRSIEKLFLSGKYEQSTINSFGEEVVYQTLSGKLQPSVLNIGLKLDSQHTTFHYLNDFYSEAEIIVPALDKGKVVGALVRLYGD